MKEITTELITELKNLIAPENKEQFNKLMGIEKSIFKKEDFITGDKVILRNGKTYLVIRDCKATVYGKQTFVLLDCSVEENPKPSICYNNNLKYTDRGMYDIMEIYRFKDGRLINMSVSNNIDLYALIWSRE